VRLAHLRRNGLLRLALKSEEGWVDLADATGDESLGRLSALLAQGDAGLEKARAAAGGRGQAEDVELGPPVDAPRRIICVGRNYRDHAEEMGGDLPTWPETFLRMPSTVIGPTDDVKAPSVSECVDYEAEFAIVIGRGGRNIAAKDADQAILGYTCVNDVSIRDWQKRGQQWTSGKNFDETLPVGPVIVTADELDIGNLHLESRLNGEVMQSASTSQLIFDVPSLIEFISTWTTLEPGDLIATGTPGGVGAAKKPPLWMKPGDVIEVEIEGIGTLRNTVVNDGMKPVTDRWSKLASEG
jgi:acylpyruvate hydrolase